MPIHNHKALIIENMFLLDLKPAITFLKVINMFTLAYSYHILTRHPLKNQGRSIYFVLYFLYFIFKVL